MNDIISTTTNDNTENLDNQLDVEILQEKNQFLMKHLDISDGKARCLDFVKEYISKDKSLIQEYEGFVHSKENFYRLLN